MTAHTKILALACVAAMLSGCASLLENNDAGPDPAEIAQAEAHMRRLPSIDETYQELTSVIQQIADASSTVDPAHRLETDVNRAQSMIGCTGPYRPTNATSMTTDRLISTEPISDTDWPTVLNQARNIAAQHGITKLTVNFDTPGRHDISLHSPENRNEIGVLSHENTVLTGLTGCRYRAQDLHQPPAPEQQPPP